jgi:hypothetical protein
MSYARWGLEGSEVYVYRNDAGQYVCCDCAREGESVWLETAAHMITHLEADRAAGYTVPEGALDRLRDEVRGSSR